MAHRNHQDHILKLNELSCLVASSAVRLHGASRLRCLILRTSILVELWI